MRGGVTTPTTEDIITMAPPERVSGSRASWARRRGATTLSAKRASSWATSMRATLP